MPDKLNILLLTVDSLRADHLGCYGYERQTSPYLDEVARQGVIAEQFIAAAIPTHPSYTTLLTGQYPTTHNVVAHGGRTEVPRDAPSLPDLFLQAGYTTCSVDNLWRQRYWFGRGFEYIIDPSARGNRLLSIDCDELNEHTIPWLRAHATEPIFLFMHYWDPHWPYVSREKYRHLYYQGNPIDPNNHSLDSWWEQYMGEVARDTWLRTPQGHITDANYVTALYDQEIRHLDDGLRTLLTAVDDLEMAERTLVVVLADHGESMDEHDIFYDHSGLYDNVLRVPMIMRLPGRVPTGLRLPRMLQHVDIAPTLLEAAGLAIPTTLEGKSFWGLVTGYEQQGGYDEVVSLECTWKAQWSLRTDRYKFILSRDADEDGTYPRELYDLQDDPGEECNLATERPDLVASLEARLEEWIAARLQAAGRTEDPLRAQGTSLQRIMQEQST